MKNSFFKKIKEFIFDFISETYGTVAMIIIIIMIITF